jgi:hypothetical protein
MDEEREWQIMCAICAADQGSKRIEAHAWATRCERHMPHMHGCAWRDNRPCDCRTLAIESLGS